MAFKFCPECGHALEDGARFCGGCGQSLTGGQPDRSAASLAGIVTLVCLLLLGGGFWLYLRLAPEAPRALKPGESAPGVMANAPAGSGAAGRARFELPDDIKSYIANLQKEAEANPEDPEKWKTLAGVYFRASRLDPAYTTKASQAYERVLELEENDLGSLRSLGALAFDRGDFQGAADFYERYLAQSPGDAEVRTELGTVYFQSGQPDLAIAEYKRVLETSPKSYQAHFNLAIVYDSQGDRETSRRELETARDLVPEPEVRERLTALLNLARDQDLSLSEAATAMRTASPPTQAPAASAPPIADAGPANSFQEAVEKLFREHRIAGPKVVEIQWPEPTVARILMVNFPMEQMPEVMKLSYLGKMKEGIEKAREQFDVEGSVRVELVDQATGNVMATVDPSEDQP